MTVVVARGRYETGPEGAWELIRAQPAAKLGEFITGYVGYVERATKPLRRLQPPTTSAKLIFSFGEPLRVATLDGHGSHLRGGFFVRFSDLPAFTEFSGECRGVEVDLTPLGAWRLLGPTIADLDSPAVELGEVIGRAEGHICERLAELDSWERRFDLIDNYIEKRLAAAEVAPPMLEWAWQRLVASGGRVKVSTLAERVGSSHAYLSRSFRRHFGISPKAAAAVLRFNRADQIIRANRGDEVSLAELAVTCGYHDQSHMTHDFRRLTGTTPAAYLKELQKRPLG